MTKGENKKMKITNIYLFFAAHPFTHKDGGGGGGVVATPPPPTYFTLKTFNFFS